MKEGGKVKKGEEELPHEGREDEEEEEAGSRISRLRRKELIEGREYEEEGRREER